MRKEEKKVVGFFRVKSGEGGQPFDGLTKIKGGEGGGGGGGGGVGLEKVIRSSKEGQKKKTGRPLVDIYIMGISEHLGKNPRVGWADNIETGNKG